MFTVHFSIILTWFVLICWMYFISLWIEFGKHIKLLNLTKMWCKIWREHQHEDRKYIERNDRPTQFCFISAQLRDAFFFENLKEVDGDICLSKCHSLKFREIILSFIRLKRTPFLQYMAPKVSNCWHV